jgi:PAS domain S-box-containing protein
MPFTKIPWKKFLLSLSFRTQLILMVLLLAIPAVGLITHSAAQQRRDSFKDGISETKMLVHMILTEQRNIVSDAEQLVTAIAQLSDVRGHRPAATHADLLKILRLNDEYCNIVVADRSGDIWASALPFNGRYSVKGNRAFENAVKTGRFSSGEYGIGRVSGKPNISLAIPIAEHGRVTDVIITSVDFARMNQLLIEAGIPEGSSFTLTDRNGIIIYHSLASAGPIGKPLNPSVFQRMKQGADEVSFLDFGLSHDKMIASYGKLRLAGEGEPYLYVKAGIPLYQTALKARRAELANIAILSPVLIVAVLLAALLGKLCFVDRIRKLQEASQRLARGELATRASEEVSGGELGELAGSFDEMAQKLAARELELLRSEAELEDLYHNAPCGYHSLDAEARFIRVNDTELAWLGYRRDEMLARPFADLVTPEGRDRFREAFRLLKERGWVSDLEYDLIRRDGSLMPVLLNATVYRAADGSFLMSRSTIYDITERKHAETRLNELNQSLAQQVEVETERRLQQERLLARQARLAAIGEMIGAIAHQWRQPLATLGAIVQSLRMAWERRVLDGAFLERAETDAQKQLYYMSDTIEDFRNFFSPDKVVESFEIREKIQEVALLVAARFANAGVALEIVDRAPGTVLRIRGYHNEFKQSVLNLVSNAFDAIVIGAESRGGLPGVVTVALGKGDGGVLVAVRDNGCGIPAGIADKIWEPYFTSKPEGKGTGIGLYMSKLIIEESMGGRLGCTPLEQGTEFRIELPEEQG